MAYMARHPQLIRGKRSCGIAFALLLCLLASPASSQAPCSGIADLLLPDVFITKAVTIDGTKSGTQVKVPHCQVDGVIGKEIHFSLILPDDWNGRFIMGGGGGYVGQVQNAALGTANLGYATVGTDTGHQGNGLRADWALDDLERQLNFGHLAVHRTAVVARALIRARYGSDPEYSYFIGCSRGGGQALMEAQRYPEDFHGIISGAPAFHWTGFMAEFVQNMQLNFPDPNDLSQSVITSDNLALLESSILKACDDIDGVQDGVMEDPRDCTFDLAGIPFCPDDRSAPDCFTNDQRAAIERVYAPTVNQDGPIYPGQPCGSEAHGWFPWITGANENLIKQYNGQIPNLQFGFGTEFFKYFVFGDPEWDYSRYDFSTWKEDTYFVSTFVDATNPDLGPFKARNGKLILWHGWSDPALTALGSIEYYEQVESLDPDVRDYFRMFLIPGMLHCGGGPGPSQVDWISLIVNWVENGTPPERVIASKRDNNGQETRTRPLCAYPQRAFYLGEGDTDRAENFACREP
jgi:hypothetical protein